MILRRQVLTEVRDYFIAELNKLPNTLIVSVSLNPSSSVAPRSDELVDQGIVFVLAAGNNGGPSYSPSNIANRMMRSMTMAMELLVVL